MHVFFFVRTHLRRKTVSPFSPFHSSRNTLASGSNLDLALKEFEQLQSLKLVEEEQEESHSQRTSPQPIEISHPWSEWVQLMELLLKKGYFAGNGGIGGPNLKDSNQIRTACLNFARDQVGLIRFFSRKDIRLIAGCGCPSLDRKVVNSGKRIRAHVGINEGNRFYLIRSWSTLNMCQDGLAHVEVCSSCDLRGNCDRAYAKAREDEQWRTVDVMRTLLTYGLDPITGSVENKQCVNKTVKESVRRLLGQMVELSDKHCKLGPAKVTTKKFPFKGEQSSQQKMLKHQIDVPLKQGDWICPKCNFVNFARNIRCLRCDGVSQERLRTLKEDQSYLPMKKGDWLCDKCNFLNFAKNTKCLQCKEKPPKRHLNPGEWECESCNYINFRRNMVCLKCDWKRPKASNSSEIASPEHRGQECRQHSRMMFVRTDGESYSQSWTGDNETDFWSGEKDDSNVAPRIKRFAFEDFPIAGGRSVVSQYPHERDEWKEMLRGSKDVPRVREMESNDDMSPLPLHGRFGLDECSDGDEMDEWFGFAKKKDNREQ